VKLIVDRLDIENKYSRFRLQSRLDGLCYIFAALVLL
jgi:hypothetical protein